MGDLERIASEYQARTGCSDAEAVEAALCIAYMLAVLASDEAAMEHFERRVTEVKAKE